MCNLSIFARMNSFPFKLPDSLNSHLELFEKQPEKAIGSLQRHLKRRGNDAVGYFLLGWFYLQTGSKEKALYYANMARAFAPGSPFFHYLPYYFQHPKSFEAWVPEHQNGPQTALKSKKQKNRFFLDIDALISRLSHPDAKKIRLDAVSGEDLKHVPFKDGDGIATPTLAKIYEQQKQYREAIKTYKKLIELKPENKMQYQEEIDRLEGMVRKQ